MIRFTIGKFLGSRRAATAVIMAMMSVPMMIASGAAVDFSRIASARAQLQTAADSAALAGAGAFETNHDGTIAYNVANTTFETSVASLRAYASVSSTVATSCNSAGKSGITCGTVSGANGTTTACAATIYCVAVTAQANLQNALLGFVIPTDALKVTSVAQSTGTSSVGVGDFHHSGVGYGSDLSAFYAYAVPTDGAGNPLYSDIPAPNSNCGNSRFGPIQYEPSVPAASGVTTCNFVLIGENSGSSGSGSISFLANDPLAFTFVNFSGGTVTNGGAPLDTTSLNSSTGLVTNTGSNTKFTKEIYVVATIGGSNPATTTNYYGSGLTVSGSALYGYCPAHSLYGSINAYPDANPADNIVPYQDSINIYSSAWLVLGWPTTHATNHALLPFLGPANTQTINGNTYMVQAICPQWPVTGTTIKATASFSPANLPSGYAPVTNAASSYPTATNVLVYSTYYPDSAYTSGSGVYPPVISGCSPATSAGDRGVTPASDDPWWGWSPRNAAQMDPGGTAENPGGSAVANCTATKLNSGGTGIVTTQDSLQNAEYNNCALIVQPLGTNVPTTNGVPDAPDYFKYEVDQTAFAANRTGNPSGIVSSVSPQGNGTTQVEAGVITPPLYSMTPVYDGGAVPTSVSISGSVPHTVTEPPAYGRDYFPPEDTSHQCYNPKANGIDGSLLPGGDQPNNDSPVTPVDPVENPEYGAVFCNTNPPPSFGLYWNDMGTWQGLYNDDLGYANAATEFTCPTPGSSGSTGPASLIQ